MSVEVWGIQGSDYDGCNGWSHWKCDGLLFSSEDKAWDYIKKNLSRSVYDTYATRYKPVKLNVG